MKTPFSDRCNYCYGGLGFCESNIWVFRKGERFAFTHDGCKDLYRRNTNAVCLGSVQSLDHVARLSPGIAKQYGITLDDNGSGNGCAIAGAKPVINRNHPLTHQHYKPPARVAFPNKGL